ncbi:MAG: HlyC/CorC family transporter [Chlamydiae bacterium]|nr:HlyC/CorC family transporter [Chlamydiota bacterium]
MILAILIIFLTLLILTSGFLSATETAFFSLSTMKVKAFKEGKDPRGHLIARLISRPRNLLVTILMLNIMLGILVQNVVASIFGTLSGWLLNVGVPLGLTLIFGEVIPKSLALANNAKMAYFSAPILCLVEKVVAPFRSVILWITGGISYVMFWFLKKERAISLEELKVALKTSKKFGFLNPEEAKLVRGYLNLEDDLIKEIMNPRQEILAFDLAKDLSVLKELFIDKQCSKVPVYEKDLENLLGIVSSDVFFIHRKVLKEGKDLKPILKKPFFIPESTPAKMLLNQFYEREEEVAIVVDEYGSISGLVTLEDLLEVVVGQIADRRDEKVLYTKAGEGVLIASGKMELAEFEEIFDVHLDSENNMATLGGWLIERFGDIPKEGEKLVTEEFLFHVLSSDPKRVRRVYIRQLTPISKKKDK